MLRVHFVHHGEIGKVGEEHSRFHYVCKSEFLIVQNGFDILDYLLSLRSYFGGDQFACGRIDGDLSCGIEKVADANGVIVRADSFGRMRWFDDCFLHAS